MVSRETLISRFFPGREEEISRYAEFLRTAGIERGLIGPGEGDRIWERHIFNSLPVISLISQGASLVDVGSGAGLPGIPIALARPDLEVTLIEPLQRRMDFLEEAAADLSITLLHGRAEEFQMKADFVTARAVAPLAKLKAMSWNLMRVGGTLLAIKGENAANEISTVKGAHLHEITLEDLPLARVISIQKTG
ncbi:MAG TPA: 16S rRNA (guanine(527)-N(7))-methyltransferase RsmG [Candidatus Nanopelagicaceae bacterium]